MPVKIFRLVSEVADRIYIHCIDRHRPKDRISFIFQVCLPWYCHFIKWEAKSYMYQPVIVSNIKIFGCSHLFFVNRDMLFFGNFRNHWTFHITSFRINAYVFLQIFYNFLGVCEYVNDLKVILPWFWSGSLYIIA